MNEQPTQEKVFKYTRGDFDKERGDIDIPSFLNNIHFRLPLLPEGQARYRERISGKFSERHGIPKLDENDPEAKKLIENYTRVFSAIDDYCRENNIKFGEEERAIDAMRERQDFLVDLYIYLRNRGFSRQEIIS